MATRNARTERRKRAVMAALRRVREAERRGDREAMLAAVKHATWLLDVMNDEQRRALTRALLAAA